MSQQRPNILWFCTDQQRFDTIRALGNSHIRTPNIDRFISQGVAFTNAYCQNPICTPSRGSFLTGCYPGTIHVHRNGNAAFPVSERLVTHRLANEGYDCGLAGKMHLSAAYGKVEDRCDDGYRLFKWSHHPAPEDFWPTEQHAYQQWLHEQGINWHEAYQGKTQAGRSGMGGLHDLGIAARYHQTTWCVEEAIKFITEERDGPWLMSLNPFDPHPPFDPPPEYMARMVVEDMPLPLFQAREAESQRPFLERIDFQTNPPQPPDSYDARRMVAAYYAQIELIDDEFGRLLNAVEASGQQDNTLIVFMSDHGETLGDHGLLFKGCRFYESLVHIPLIFSWPGHFEAGLHSNALVELTDVAPTLYEAAGLPVPEFVQGRSLIPILTGQADPQHHRDFVRSEYHGTLNKPIGSHANMIFDGRYKLCIYHDAGLGELFDLQNDPHEFNNLWDDPAAQQIKWPLMQRCFDDIMINIDIGQPRIGRF